MKKQNPIIMTLSDYMYQICPWLFMVFMMILSDVNPNELFTRPEISLISVLLIMAAISDSQGVWESEGYSPKHIGAATQFAMIILGVVILQMAIDYQATESIKSRMTPESLSWIRWSVFALCSAMFAKYRYRRHSMKD